MTTIEFDHPIDVPFRPEELDIDYDAPIEPTETREAREALYAQLEGFFGADEITGKRIFRTQVPNTALVIESRPAKLARVGPRALSVYLTQGDSRELATLNAVRARSHNLARMAAPALRNMSRIISEAAQASGRRAQ